MMGDTVFAHGGSGYVLSQSAAHAAVEVMKQRPHLAAELAQHECCGDLVMALMLKEVGTPISSGLPVFQGETPSTIEFDEDRWCSPVATFHHISTDDIRALWEFEQQRSSEEPIVRREIYYHYIESRLQPVILYWDNMSSEQEQSLSSEDAAHDSVEACRAVCEIDEACLQFSWKAGACSTAAVLRLGHKDLVYGVQSEFMMERVNRFVDQLGDCAAARWPDR